MRRMLTLAIPLTLVLALLFQASAPARAQEGGFPPGVVRVTWRLLEIQRSPGNVLDTSHLNVTLTFDGQGQAGGESTCNFYGVPYEVGPGQALTFDTIITTLRACVDQSLMDLETEYYSALEAVESYSFDGATLQLFYGNGSVLRFGTDSAPAPVPGMPKTGVANPHYIPFLVLGVLVVVLGAILLGRKRGLAGQGE